MNVTYKIKMDLARKEPLPSIDLVQDDQYSRIVQIGLFVNGLPWQVPEGCSVLIRYRKADGIGGIYDTLPDGTKAWEIQDNQLLVKLAPQVCTAAGETTVTVSLMKEKVQLSCFALRLRIQELSFLSLVSEPYENVRFCLPQPRGARKGEFLRVAQVDAQGHVTVLETAAAAAGGGSGASDWNAEEGEAGHVLNRTHWVETVMADPTFDGDLTDREALDISEIFGMEAYLVKISAEGLTVDEMVGAVVSLYLEDTYITQELSGETVLDAQLVLGVSGTVVILDNQPVVFSFQNDTVLQGVTITMGTWFLYVPGIFYVESLSCLEAGEVELVHKLDEKFLPKNIFGTTVVTVTDDGSGNYTADKTFEELNQAYQKGRVLYCAYNSARVLLHLAGVNPGYQFRFEGVQSESDADTIAVSLYRDSIAVTPKTVVSQSDLPTKLPNPSKIMFVGALAGTANNDSYMSVKNHEYDGSGRLYVRGIPNPKALTINGTSYDGKTAVTLELPTAGLPEVTEENNGAFLRVVNGLWTAAAITNAEGVSF